MNPDLKKELDRIKESHPVSLHILESLLKSIFQQLEKDDSDGKFNRHC